MGPGSVIGHARKALAASIVAAFGSHCAEASVYNVTNANDAGPGSLRDALVQANGNLEADTIDLSAISGQTIALTIGELQTYSDEITINGAGVTIDAGGNSRVLYAFDSDVTINDLTITGGTGFAGGGISAKYGSLALNDSVVTGNAAFAGGGVYALTYFGNISINRSRITGNTAVYAGGVYALAVNDDVIISDSVISENRAERGQFPPTFGPYWGGAKLFAYRGDTVVSGSTISGNFSEGGVGGLSAGSGEGVVTIEASTISDNVATFTFSQGGGVASAGSVRLRNSTISGNSSSGVGGFAAYASFGGNGELMLEFVTVTNNSSASVGGLMLSSSGSLELVGSVIAGNTAPVHRNLAFSDVAQSADVAFTLIGVDPSIGTLNKDAVSTALTGQNPLLGPLADNGGPTFAHLPAWTSPLLDAIPPGDAGCGTMVTADQRGESRPTGPGCDIGALELTGTPPPAIPEAHAVPVFDRVGLAVMAGLMSLLGLMGIRRRL